LYFGFSTFWKNRKFEILKILVLQFFGEPKISEKFPKNFRKISEKFPKKSPKIPNFGRFLGKNQDFWGS